jgi:hypothetical protein
MTVRKAAKRWRHDIDRELGKPEVEVTADTRPAERKIDELGPDRDRALEPAVRPGDTPAVRRARYDQQRAGRRRRTRNRKRRSRIGHRHEGCRRSMVRERHQRFVRKEPGVRPVRKPLRHFSVQPARRGVAGPDAVGARSSGRLLSGLSAAPARPNLATRCHLEHPRGSGTGAVCGAPAGRSWAGNSIGAPAAPAGDPMAGHTTTRGARWRSATTTARRGWPRTGCRRRMRS